MEKKKIMKKNIYKPAISLVNGEIIKDLLDLCNYLFNDPFIKPFPNGSTACRFCGFIVLKNETKGHTIDCPVVKYQEIADKHKRFIVKI